MMINRDLFAQIYSPLGWVNYDRFSTDIVAKVLDMNLEDGEIELTSYHLNPDNLRFWVTGFVRVILIRGKQCMNGL